MSVFPKIKLMNERAILIEFQPVIENEQLEKILFYKKLLKEYYSDRKVEVINTYSSLLIYFISPEVDLQQELSVFEEKLKNTTKEKISGKHLFEIPVCYDAEFGPDLQFISEEKKLPVEEIIRRHNEPVYTVYFIGFLPGFLYLGGLDPKLYTSRKKEPRMEVRKGAVGIGEKQTGIYPKNSPGGWQIIGNSPVPFFNKKQQPPCEITAGDRIRFSAVSKEEYLEINSEVEKGNYQFKKELFNG